MFYKAIDTARAQARAKDATIEEHKATIAQLREGGATVGGAAGGAGGGAGAGAGGSAAGDTGGDSGAADMAHSAESVTELRATIAEQRAVIAAKQLECNVKDAVTLLFVSATTGSGDKTDGTCDTPTTTTTIEAATTSPLAHFMCMCHRHCSLSSRHQGRSSSCD